MTTVSASLVKELRDQTGAGMMDCKRALEEAGGDLEGARRILREKGMASAAKRAERSTPEGVVKFAQEGNAAALVAVGCETEPVSKNDEFQAFAEQVLRGVLASGPGAVEELEDERQQLVGKLGENIQVVGAVRYEAGEGERIGSYVHPPANKIGAIVRVEGGGDELARELAMHLSFARPRFVAREQVPAGDVEAEREVQMNMEDVASKPENVREQMVEGRLQKWFADSVLLEQEWFRGGAKTKDELGDMEVLDFAVYALGA
jgi:elongation factor Ts